MSPYVLFVDLAGTGGGGGGGCFSTQRTPPPPPGSAPVSSIQTENECEALYMGLHRTHDLLFSRALKRSGSLWTRLYKVKVKEQIF